MRQALHIFRKDSRQFRVPIAVMVAWTAWFGWSVAAPWPEAIFSLPESFRGTLLTRFARQLADFLFPAAWCFLIAQVLHAESLVGERQFWLTRPYHRGSLAAAKALFVLAYITLPLALAQAAIVVLSGLPLAPNLPGLFWAQALVTLVILLPAAALASLTSRLSQFVLVALGAPAMVALSGGLSNWQGLEWARATVFVVMTMTVALAVLILQFRRRRTPIARLAGLLGALALLVVLPQLRWSSAFAVQARVQGAWEGPVAVDLTRAKSVGVWAGTLRGLQLEFRLRGLPEGVAIMCRAHEIAIRSATGAIWRRDTHVGHARVSDEPTCAVGVPVPASFLEPAVAAPATLEAVLYVTVLGPARTVPVPADRQPVGIPGGAFCVAQIDRRHTPDGPRDFTGIECRTAFRESRTLLNWQGRDLGGFTLSPWPATLRVYPLAADSSVLPRTQSAVPLTVREPIAHLRTVVTAESIMLRDYEVGR